MARHSFHFIVFVLLCVFLPKVSNDESSPLNSTRPARELLVSSHRESLRIVHEASLLSGQRRSGAAPTWLRQSEPETREVSQAAEVFHATLQVLESTARPRYEREVTAPEPLSWEDVELIAELSECPPVPHPAACLQSPLDKYRSISGLCNNRQNPLWGAANTPLVRWLPAEYEDGEREPKGWNRGRLHNGFQLPPIITMRDYVPKIIGQAAFDSYIGPYRGYDPATDPSASNVFATAAFRFGHATIPPVLRRLNESFQTHEHFGDLRLHQTFFSPWRIVKEGGIEPILRGAFGTAASAGSADMLLTEEITERLVVLNLPRPMDLASLNLQRGRDHALPGYNDWRSFCGLERIKEMEGLKGVVRDHAVAEKMARIYKHPDNVDVWLGGLVEHMPPGSRTGPLFACLIGKQMKALRDGDRFWWEAEGVFSQRQRAQLLKASLSRIICDNSDIREVPPDSFRFGRYPYDYIPCDRVPSIDLEAWQEETDHDMEQCGIPRMIKNGDFILSSTNGKLVALYSCYHGFKLKGAAAVVCQGNQWSDQPPQCTGNHR